MLVMLRMELMCFTMMDGWATGKMMVVADDDVVVGLGWGWREDGLQLWEWSQGGQRSLQFLSQWGSASRKPEPATSVSWPASLGELSANISFGADQRATRAPISSESKLQSENNSKQTSRASGGDPLDRKQCKCSHLSKVYPQSQKKL